MTSDTTITDHDDTAADGDTVVTDEEYPESWLPWKNPDQPRTLVDAEILNYGLAPDFGYGRSWTCAVADREDRRWTVWIGVPPAGPSDRPSVLYRQFDDEKPMPGERITIRYVGFVDKPKGGGPGYRNVRLTVHRGPELPAFLLAPPPDEEVPLDTAGLPPAPSVDVPDAIVVDEPDVREGGDNDDDDIPF